MFNETPNVNFEDNRNDHYRHIAYRPEEQFQGTVRNLENIQQSQEQEMVAQDMAQSYAHIFHSSQDSQGFLEELQPKYYHQEENEVHNNDLTNTSSMFYQQEQITHEQLRYHGHPQNLYNLSIVNENPCATVYFDSIKTGTGLEELPAGSAGAGKGLNSLNPTPAISNGSGISTTSSTVSAIITSVTSNTTVINTLGTIIPTNIVPDNKITYNSNSNTTVNVTSSQSLMGVELPRHMETSPTMVPDHAPDSGHHYHHHPNCHRHHNHHHHHHRRTSTTTSYGPSNPDISDELAPIVKKRKHSHHDSSETFDDTGGDAKSVRTNDDSKKQNHSEIEKRRRDKMNTYITELSAMVPMCHAMSRKLDKLTVLRMAVQHMKSILDAVTSYTEDRYKSAFLSDQELKTLILQAAEGFVFVVGCDRGRILYVSESVSQTLNYSQSDLLSLSWFDILHPKDVAKVKEQLSSSNLSPRERLIDAKTMLPVKTDVPQGVSRLCPGARRSFFCRMKRKVDGARCPDSQVKENLDNTSSCQKRKKQQNVDWRYCVIQCTGYLKSWAPAKARPEEQEGETENDACNLSCLVAVGRVQPPLPIPLASRGIRLQPTMFVSRHAVDGEFLYIDQKATLVLGFLPQELLGTSMYEYYHHDDIPHVAESHKAVLQASERVFTQIYRFRSKGASFVRLQSEWKSFRNPWTKDIECMIAKNLAISCEPQIGSGVNRSDSANLQENYNYFTQNNGCLDKVISSHVEVSKIGRQIAEEVLDLQRRCEDSFSGNSPGPGTEPVLMNTKIVNPISPKKIHKMTQPVTKNDITCNNSLSTYNQTTEEQLNNIANDQGTPLNDDMMKIIGSTAINESPNPIPSDGNDEAAMAVIMSLLEADAGLGGPVDFSGLPWPLP